MLYERGKYAAAVPVLAEAVKKAPEAQVLQYHLGMAQLKAGDRSAARASLELAVKGDATLSRRRGSTRDAEESQVGQRLAACWSSRCERFAFVIMQLVSYKAMRFVGRFFA